jgi:hypothetical protein
MQKACDGPWSGDASSALAPLGYAYGHGNRACDCGGDCWVDMYAS